jgi:hypothetical protein
MKEFITEEYRWANYDELKQKIVRYMETSSAWELKRRELWSKIKVLTPEAFQEKIWTALQTLDIK